MTEPRTLMGDTQHILACWVKGWALVRGVPPPVPDHGGFRTDVDWPEQKTRYVFARPDEGYRQLANAITEPYVHLKVCASPEEVRAILPGRWCIQPVGYIMICTQPMRTAGRIPEEYHLYTETRDALTIAKVMIGEHEIASVGRIVFADGYAVYDRIETHPDHRRKGLATAVMQALEAVGFEAGITRSVLVATADGRALYEKLGWELLSVYTTAVILPQ